MGDGNAFFQPGDDNEFLPTPHTVGPWDSRHQHGGPPAALLTRAVEELLARDELSLGRVSFDILGPVPLVPLRVQATVLRPGRRVQLIQATLSAYGQPLVIATAWAIRPAPDELPAPDPAARDPAHFAAPASLPPDATVPHPRWRCGFLAATEWRFLRGGYGQKGPATVWMRPRLGLLPGEPMSPAQRVVLTADSANGVSAVLDIDTWAFIAPELTVHFLRPPRGTWLCLDATSTLAPGSIGLATALLSDVDGVVATSGQAMLVAPRSGPPPPDQPSAASSAR